MASSQRVYVCRCRSISARPVAALHRVGVKRIERWARGKRPHGEERFREFERRLSENE
jgi:hypothetical protein